MKPVGGTLSNSFSSCSRTSNSVNNSPRWFSALARSTVCWKKGFGETHARHVHPPQSRPLIDNHRIHRQPTSKILQIL